MKSTSSLINQFKSEIRSKFGVSLDFRQHRYLSSLDYDTAKIIVKFLYDFSDNIIEENPENFPEFKGFVYNLSMSVEQLRSITLKDLIEGVLVEIEAHYIDKYRIDTGSVFEYDRQQRAYIFIGKLNGLTSKQFIADYELNVK